MLERLRELVREETRGRWRVYLGAEESEGAYTNPRMQAIHVGEADLVVEFECSMQSHNA